MTSQQDVVLRAIAAYGLPGSLADLPQDPPTATHWKALVPRVRANRLEGLLWEAISNDAISVTDDQRAEAAAAHTEAMCGAVRIESTLLDVVRDLAKVGIEARVLKGSAVAHLDYPSPELRPFGDADLLVQPEAIDEAVRTLERSGFVRRSCEPRPGFDRRYGKGATLTGRGIEIDLHRTFVTGPFGARIQLDDLWTDKSGFTVGGEKMRALAPDVRFLHACYTVAIGDTTPRLVAERDVAQMLLAGTLRPARIRQLASRWEAEAVLARAVRVVWDHLRIADITSLSSWAQRYHPTAKAERDVALYTTPGVSDTAQALAAIPAIHGPMSKARFVLSLGFPRRDYTRPARSRFSGRLVKGWRDLVHARAGSA